MNSPTASGLAAYYIEVNEWQRLTWDTKSAGAEQSPFLLKRFFPIAKGPADIEGLEQFQRDSLEFVELLALASAPISVPRCLRCCFRNKPRTSCGIFYKLLFGETKQLGYILKNTFNADHFWVPVEGRSCCGRRVKLDCMFFKGVSANMTETLAELEDWQAKPTFIVCNSNAMFYQQMVH